MKDYRATFDLSDADWKAIDKALSLLEEKFMALRDITDEDRAWQVPFSTRAEAFCRKAVDVMVKDRDVLIDTDVDLDEIRGDLLSIDELRPRIGRLAALLLEEALDLGGRRITHLDRQRLCLFTHAHYWQPLLRICRDYPIPE